MILHYLNDKYVCCCEHKYFNVNCIYDYNMVRHIRNTNKYALGSIRVSDY